MVIHENFDWRMIENIPNHNTAKNNEKSLNGFGQQAPRTGTYTENDINYDSLIEQVECSSQSENGESDEQLHVKEKGQVIVLQHYWLVGHLHRVEKLYEVPQMWLYNLRS